MAKKGGEKMRKGEGKGRGRGNSAPSEMKSCVCPAAVSY